MGGPIAGKCSKRSILRIMIASLPWSPRKVAVASISHNRNRIAIPISNNAIQWFVRIVRMWRRILPYCTIAFVVLLSTVVLWLPFLLRFTHVGYVDLGRIATMLDVYNHWDGPLYIIAAKTLYNFQHELFQEAILGLSPAYFAAHLPLYPLLLMVPATIFGYLKATLFVSVLFAVFYLWAFYFMVSSLKLTKHPLILTVVAAFITPRFFVVRSVGAPETVFLFFTIVSMFFFIKKKYLFAGLAGALAVATKTPGIILFGAYFLYFIEQFMVTRKMNYAWFWILLIPFGLLSVFGLYGFQTGDFLAYFHSGDNIHVLFPPFQVFDLKASWVGTAWIEEVLFLFLFYGVALVTMWSKKDLRPIFYFMSLFFIAIISIEHRDIARYSLPMLPFALIAFEKFFTSKQFLIVGIFLIPALYFYSWNFMIENRAPITDWKPFR